MRLQKAVTTTTCSEKALSRERASWRMSVSAMRILAHCSSLQGRGGEGRGGEGRGDTHNIKHTTTIPYLLSI